MPESPAKRIVGNCTIMIMPPTATGAPPESRGTCTNNSAYQTIFWAVCEHACAIQSLTKAGLRNTPMNPFGGSASVRGLSGPARVSNRVSGEGSTRRSLRLMSARISQ